ncbi:MAG: hypothetical protein WAW90_00775 [Minisyncoccia bacterium]
MADKPPEYRKMFAPDVSSGGFSHHIVTPYDSSGITLDVLMALFDEAKRDCPGLEGKDVNVSHFSNGCPGIMFRHDVRLEGYNSFEWGNFPK